MEALDSNLDLAVKDLPFALPVLSYLGVDIKKLFDEQKKVFDGSDCGSISTSKNSKQIGHVSRLMIVRLSNVVRKVVFNTEGIDNFQSTENIRAENSESSQTSWTSARYFQARKDKDPFPSLSVADLPEKSRMNEVHERFTNMPQNLDQCDMLQKRLAELNHLAIEKRRLFCTSFLSNLLAKVPPLIIKILEDFKPVQVCLRNFLMKQREFFTRLTTRLIDAGMAYYNTALQRARAHFLVPKKGPAMFRFTMHLRPVNRFIEKKQYPVPNVEQKLHKLSSARYFAYFDLTHGYWQLPLAKYF